jgi:hypothetical protein
MMIKSAGGMFGAESYSKQGRKTSVTAASTKPPTSIKSGKKLNDDLNL